MPKSTTVEKEEVVRFTICLPVTLNADFREFLHRQDLKRQRVIRQQIEKWVQELKATKAAKTDDQQVA